MYPLVFITGGLRRGLNKEFEAMDISELIIFNIQTKRVKKTKLKGLETTTKLFAVSLTQRPTTTRTELLLFGGSSLDRDALSSDQYKKSESYYWIYPDEETIVEEKITEAKAAIAGSSVHWLNSQSAILYGGTQPRKGLGGRSVFLLTASTVKQKVCDSAECIVDQTKDTKLITCTVPNCHSSLHISCDINLRKRRTKIIPKVIQ